MRKSYFIFFFLVLMFLTPAGSWAQGEESKKQWRVVPAGQIIKKDYGAFGEVVEISGTVLGDVYAVAGQIFIDGIVDGDVLALGGIVHISGVVTQDIRIAGGQVVISGEIGRNATIIATHVTFTDTAKIGGSVVVGGANVFISSSVGREVRVAGRNFTLSGAVEEDVEAAVENIRITEKAKVGGDFTYWSNQDAFIDKDASISGAIARKSPQQFTGRFQEMAAPFLHWIRPFLGLSSFFTTLIFGLLLIRFFHGYMKTAVYTLRNHTWRALTGGIFTLLVIPVLFGLLIITIVGIPLGFVLLLASSVMLYGARIFVMLLMGQIVMKRLPIGQRGAGDGVAFFAGLVIYSLLILIPVVGWIVSFAAMLFGLGAAIEAMKETYAKSKA